MRALTVGQVKRMGVVVWTYSGGVVRPVTLAGQTNKAAAKRAKRFGLRPNPAFNVAVRDLDLSGIEAELRAAVEASLQPL